MDGGWQVGRVSPSAGGFADGRQLFSRSADYTDSPVRYLTCQDNDSTSLVFLSEIGEFISITAIRRAP